MHQSSYPLVSVIIPVYNCEKYLPLSLDSILNQTYQNIEILIVDDCSTDGTRNILKKYKQKYSNKLRIFYNKKNLGVASSLNFLVKKTKSNYIFRMDGDDISYNTRITQQLEYISRSENKDLMICGGYVKVINDSGSCLYNKRFPISNSDVLSKIFFYTPVCHPAMLIRKEIFTKYKVKYNSIRYAEDLDLLFQCYTKDLKIGNLPSYILKYRIHPNSETYSNIKLSMNSCTKVRLAYLSILPLKLLEKAKFRGLLFVLPLIPSKLIVIIFNFLRYR